MEQEDFEMIIKQIMLIEKENNREFIKTSLMGNFKKWQEKQADERIKKAFSK